MMQIYVNQQKFPNIGTTYLSHQQLYNCNSTLTMLMKKDMIFFSPDGEGLTSTSANHIANMAKEMIRNLDSSVANLVFYTTEVSLIGVDSRNVLQQGSTDADVLSVAGRLRIIAQAKSLIAWLREAIKARERLINEAESLTLEDYAKEKGITLEKEPEMGTALTEDDYYASLSLDERNRYYELETLAAVIGEEIHPGGHFAEARAALTERFSKPHEVKGDGRDTLIYTFTPSVNDTIVEDTYFSLQKQYREAQARLNSIKYNCRKAVMESEVKVKTEYAEAMKRHNAERRLLEAELAKDIRKRVKEIAEYRIIIPASLKNIFDDVSRLGKKNNDTDRHQ